MADVRSLLRSELASRRIKHPHVSYSSSGLALCTVCHLQLKSDALWEPHQRSKNHKANLQKLRDEESNNGPVSKKRKVESDDSEDEGRKKVKSRVFDGSETRNPEAKEASEDDVTVSPIATQAQFLSTTDGAPEATHAPAPTTLNQPQSPQSPQSQTVLATDAATPLPTSLNESSAVNEDEWAAFERDVAQPTHQNPASLLNSSATITAMPMSAAELAAAEASAKPRKLLREEEIEGEKEDAARQLEEEFDEMEELEEKLRKLKERVEKIRRRKGIAEEVEGVSMDVVSFGEGAASNEKTDGSRGTVEDDSEDEDDEDEDEWDGWGLS